MRRLVRYILWINIADQFNLWTKVQTISFMIRRFIKCFIILQWIKWGKNRTILKRLRSKRCRRQISGKIHPTILRVPSCNGFSSRKSSRNMNNSRKQEESWIKNLVINYDWPHTIKMWINEQKFRRKPLSKPRKFTLATIIMILIAILAMRNIILRIISFIRTMMKIRVTWFRWVSMIICKRRFEDCQICLPCTCDIIRFYFVV